MQRLKLDFICKLEELDIDWMFYILIACMICSMLFCIVSLGYFCQHRERSQLEDLEEFVER
jgi:hypothetical protein